jgi:prolyl oligopeptidase
VTPPGSSTAAAPRLHYPAAERLELVERLHGREVADPYRWLEDPADPRTVAWSDAQDELYAEQAAGWPGRDGFAARVRELLSAGVVGVPIWRGDRRFFVRREGTQEHGVLLTADDDGAERVLVDPIALDPTGRTTLDAWQPSMEGDLLAYQLSEGGTEESVLRVLDVGTGEQVEGPIDRARYSPVAWLPGGTGYYYVRRLDPAGLLEDERQYHRRVWFHRVGSDPDTDAEIFGAGLDIRSYYGVAVSRDGRWLTVSAATGTAPRNDVWIAPLVAADGSAADPATPVLADVAVGLDAHIGTYVGRDGRLYVATDLDAPRGRLAVTSPSDPGPDTWRDLLPEDPEAVLEDYVILDGPELAQRPLLLASWTRHAVSEITVHELASGDRLPTAAGGVAGSSGAPRAATRPGSRTPTTRPCRTCTATTGETDPCPSSAVHRGSSSPCPRWSRARWATCRRTGRPCGCSCSPART